jgi:flagellar biosynthesis/type III secretory pathway M-ring protein FliF/YscJ
MTTQSIIALIGMLICAIVIVCLVRLAIRASRREREEELRRRENR